MPIINLAAWVECTYSFLNKRIKSIYVAAFECKS